MEAVKLPQGDMQNYKGDREGTERKVTVPEVSYP